MFASQLRQMSKFGEGLYLIKAQLPFLPPAADHNAVDPFPSYTGSQGLPRMDLAASKENSTMLA